MDHWLIGQDKRLEGYLLYDGGFKRRWQEILLDSIRSLPHEIKEKYL